MVKHRKSKPRQLRKVKTEAMSVLRNMRADLSYLADLAAEIDEIGCIAQHNEDDEKTAQADAAYDDLLEKIEDYAYTVKNEFNL